MAFTNETHTEADDPSELLISVVLTGYVCYALAIVFGIPANLFVLYRMNRLSRQCSDLYSNGAGLCLFVMAVADLLSLCSIFTHYVLSISTETFSARLYFPDSTLTAICKIVTFSMHVSTFTSIWSWLLMSTLRYLSVYHPLLYLRLWRLPIKGMASVVCAAVAFNVWLLVAVVSEPVNGGCTMVSIVANRPLVNKTFLLLECSGSFIVPTLIILYVDASVMCGTRFRLNSKDNDLRKNVSPRNHKQHSFLLRWLVIALIDIGLNAPENLVRLSLILGLIDVDVEAQSNYFMYRVMAQVPYYLQFGFNGVYLALFIYDKQTRPTRGRIQESASTHDVKSKEHDVLVDHDSGIDDRSL